MCSRKRRKDADTVTCNCKDLNLVGYSVALKSPIINTVEIFVSVDTYCIAVSVLISNFNEFILKIRQVSDRHTQLKTILTRCYVAGSNNNASWFIFNILWRRSQFPERHRLYDIRMLSAPSRHTIRRRSGHPCVSTVTATINKKSVV